MFRDHSWRCSETIYSTIIQQERMIGNASTLTSELSSWSPKEMCIYYIMYFWVFTRMPQKELHRGCTFDHQATVSKEHWCKSYIYSWTAMVVLSWQQNPKTLLKMCNHNYTHTHIHVCTHKHVFSFLQHPWWKQNLPCPESYHLKSHAIIIGQSVQFFWWRNIFLSLDIILDLLSH